VSSSYSEQLESEYKIVQDKIDKIGAFRFTIRGWTVTLVTAAILAVASAKFLSPLALLFLFVFLVVFAAIEHEQNINQEVFENRAFEIEVEFRRLQSQGSGSQTSQLTSPKIAHALRDRSLQNVGTIRRFIEDPDRWFYWILALVVFAAVLFLRYVRPQDPSVDHDIRISVTNQAEATGSRDGGTPSPSPQNTSSQISTKNKPAGKK